MKRTIGAILFVIYSIIAITVTVLLLSYNDYNCSEIGGYTVFIVKDDALEPKYKQGSILLIKSTDDKHVQKGDSLFFYKVIDSQNYELVNRTLEQKTQQGRHIVYNVSEQESYDSTYFIGKEDDTIVIEGPWGTILSILESKWGYLFCIVIVSLLLFLQEVFDLIVEIKYGGIKKEIQEQAKATQEVEKITEEKPVKQVKKATPTKTEEPAKKATVKAVKTETTTKKATAKVAKTETKEKEESK